MGILYDGMSLDWTQDRPQGVAHEGSARVRLDLDARARASRSEDGDAPVALRQHAEESRHLVLRRQGCLRKRVEGDIIPMRQKGLLKVLRDMLKKNRFL